MSYWQQFCKHRLGMIGLIVVILFALLGLYAPFLASSKPFIVQYEGQWFFPLFRYLFYPGFFSKRLDVFYNLLMLLFPFFWLTWRHKRWIAIVALQFFGFLFLILHPPLDPASSKELTAKRIALTNQPPSWSSDLLYMTDYAKLNLVLQQRERKLQHERLQKLVDGRLSTLWQQAKDNEALLASPYIQEKNKWLESQTVSYIVMPPLRHFHWEDDAGGDQSLNKEVSFWDLTRTNRKDLGAALIFGIRISLTVGIISVLLALTIGIPIGAVAGYFGGKLDIIVSRLLEIWEAMPTFFMLLMVVAVTQSKSIFLVIFVIGFFGWTHFSRYIRGEFFKQRSLPYVEACRAQAFSNPYIMFRHILPNAIPPILTLLPFAIMGAISSEAGLSFLGLGEEGSASWGILMDEGRTAFPGESYLLWPPAFLLTTLLIAIALVGDALRDVLDPKL